ncbi:MAG: NYN domain-containing protein [Alphaproteobacteria bacterium]
MSMTIPVYPEEKVALFIDGSNLYAVARALEFDIDYRRLRIELARRCRLVRAYYYTAMLDEQEYSPIRPLVDWLDYNGYTIISKPTRKYTDAQGREKIKGNMNMELAVDAMELADHIDHAIIISGDGEFRRLIEAMQRKAVRVTVMSTIRSTPPMISDDLRRQADCFLDIADLRDQFGRKDGAPPQSLRPSDSDDD